jgi:hypothetical protein
MVGVNVSEASVSVHQTTLHNTPEVMHHKNFKCYRK